MQDNLFDDFERDLAGTVTSEWRHGAVAHAFELANAEWTEDEAACELARANRPDDVRAAYSLVLSSLMSKTRIDIRGIRAARILLRALDKTTPGRAASMGGA